MGEKLLIIIMFKSMDKCECVKVLLEPSNHFSLKIIFIIINLFPDSMPTNVLFLFLLLRETQYFHTVVVKRIRFSQVDYIESVFLPLFEIMNSIEKPLSVTISVDIILQNQIVFILGYLIRIYFQRSEFYPQDLLA
jgi:hypothetical protein